VHKITSVEMEASLKTRRTYAWKIFWKGIQYLAVFLPLPSRPVRNTVIFRHCQIVVTGCIVASLKERLSVV